MQPLRPLKAYLPPSPPRVVEVVVGLAEFGRPVLQRAMYIGLEVRSNADDLESEGVGFDKWVREGIEVVVRAASICTQGICLGIASRLRF